MTSKPSEDEDVGEVLDGVEPPVDEATEAGVVARPVAIALPTSPPAAERLVSPRTLRQVAVLGFAGILAAAGLYLARGTIIPFIVALLGAYLILPLVDAMARRRIPRWLGVVLAYGAVIIGGFLLVRFVVPPLFEQVEALLATLPLLATRFRDWYVNVDLDPAVRSFIDATVDAIAETVRTLDLGSLIGPAFQSAAGLVATVIGYAFAPFFVFYVVLDRDRIVRTFDRSLPEPWRADVWAVLGIGDDVFGEWIRSTIVLGAILAAATAIGMAIFGVVIDPVFARTAVVLATLAFFSEFIPIIGPFFPLIAGGLIGLTVGPGAGIAAVVFFFALAQIEANILVPRIQGRALSLHPAGVIAVLIMGTAAAGLLGALLAIPIVATVVPMMKYLFRRASGLIDPPPTTPRSESNPLVDSLIPGVVRPVGP